jgi:hypothetical protein
MVMEIINGFDKEFIFEMFSHFNFSKTVVNAEDDNQDQYQNQRNSTSKLETSKSKNSKKNKNIKIYSIPKSQKTLNSHQISLSIIQEKNLNKKYLRHGVEI